MLILFAPDSELLLVSADLTVRDSWYTDTFSFAANSEKKKCYTFCMNSIMLHKGVFSVCGLNFLSVHQKFYSKKRKQRSQWQNERTEFKSLLTTTFVVRTWRNSAPISNSARCAWCGRIFPSIRSTKLSTAVCSIVGDVFKYISDAKYPTMLRIDWRVVSTMVSFHSERSEKPEKVTKIVSGFTTWKRKIVRNSIQEMHGLGKWSSMMIFLWKAILEPIGNSDKILFLLSQCLYFL